MDETRRDRVMRTAANTTTLALQRGDLRPLLDRIMERAAPSMAAG